LLQPFPRAGVVNQYTKFDMEWWVFPAGFAAFWTLFIGVSAWLGSDSVPNLRLQRKHVIVTGGSDGLGLELCKLLAKKGAHVSIIARDLKKLEIAATSVRGECKDQVWLSAQEKNQTTLCQVTGRALGGSLRDPLLVASRQKQFWDFRACFFAPSSAFQIGLSSAQSCFIVDFS
jgi:hypothetical protein